ncbi:MAG: methylmalonyl-CoA mutase family protein [Bacteroidota bacterium]
MQNLFDAFEPASKSDWNAFVANDPRSAALLEKLDWQLGDLSMPAYATDEDLLAPSETQVNWVLPESWCIAACAPEDAPTTFYETALADGADGFWMHALSTTYPTNLPAKHLHLYGDACTGEAGLAYLNALHETPAMISVVSDPATDEAFLKANMAQLIAHSPCRTITLPVSPALPDPVASLVKTLQAIHTCIDIFKAGGYSTDETLRTMALVYQPSTSFYLELAMMRAMRLLISKLVAGTIGGDIDLPFMAYINTSDDPDQLLKQTTIAMGAVLGGCSTICIVPGDTYAQHLAQNTQLILKHESHLHRVTDPAAGSYYVEMLSGKLANAAWNASNFAKPNGGQDHA